MRTINCQSANRSSRRVLWTSLLLLSLVSACSGDPRPLEEAVEASQIGLTGLTIGSAVATDNITINPGESLQFNLQAVGIDGQDLTVANIDRRWSVSDNSVAKIDHAGFFTAIANGRVTVGLRIAGIVAAPVEITVSDATLTSISIIEGSMTLVECSMSGSFRATGEFDDGSTRVLQDLIWTLQAGSSGKLLQSSTTEAIVGAQGQGAVTLLVRSGDVTDSVVISVISGLSALEILPPVINVETGATLPLAAQAAYTDSSSTVVTRLVDWSVDESAGFASISNATFAEGVLSGINVGVTIVTARCASVTTTADVNVVVPGPVAQLDVYPDDDPIEIKVGGAGQQLTVYSVTAHGSTIDRTNKATYVVISGGDSVSVDTVGAERGLVTAKTGSSGSAIVEVSYGGIDERINILVR